MTHSVRPGHGATWPADPRDQLHPVFWKIWVQIISEALIVELIALGIEWVQAKEGRSDRLKRTFSAFWRFVFGSDSITGIPLDVPYGRLRRFAGGLFLWWFTRHVMREGDV